MVTRNGWTVPTFYNSMSADELRTLLDLGGDARKKGIGFWPYVARIVGKLDFDLRYRDTTPPPAADDDAGSSPNRSHAEALPARLSAWAVNKRATMVSGSFKAHLENKRDICYLIDEFLDQGATAATPRNLSEFIGAKQSLLASPQDLVFHEDGAKLIGPDGKTPVW
jgi:hypothetical protein